MARPPRPLVGPLTIFFILIGFLTFIYWIADHGLAPYTSALERGGKARSYNLEIPGEAPDSHTRFAFDPTGPTAPLLSSRTGNVPLPVTLYMAQDNRITGYSSTGIRHWERAIDGSSRVLWLDTRSIDDTRSGAGTEILSLQARSGNIHLLRRGSPWKSHEVLADSDRNRLGEAERAFYRPGTSEFFVAHAKGAIRRFGIDKNGQVQMLRWRVPGESASQEWHLHRGPIKAHAFAPSTTSEGTILATTSPTDEARRIRIVHLSPDGEVLRSQAIRSRNLYISLAVHPDGDLLAAGRNSGEIDLYRTKSGGAWELQVTLPGSFGSSSERSVEGLAFLPSQRLLLAVERDHLSIWDHDRGVRRRHYIVGDRVAHWTIQPNRTRARGSDRVIVVTVGGQIIFFDELPGIGARP